MVTNTHLLNGYMTALLIVFLHGCVFVCPSVDVCVLVLFVWVVWVGPWALFVANGKYSKMSNTLSLSVLK